MLVAMPVSDPTNTSPPNVADLPAGSARLDVERTFPDGEYVWHIAGEATNAYYEAINKGLAPALIWGAFVLGLKGDVTAIQYISRVQDEIGLNGLSEKLTALRANKGGNGSSSQPPPPTPPVAGGGSGPHDPDMEARVTNLEADMKDVKASLKGLELSLVRIEAVLGTLATKTDIERGAGDTRTLAEALHGLDTRVKNVETGSLAVANAAIARNLGPWQLPAVLGATIVVGGAALAGAGYLLHLAGVLH